MEKPVLLPKGSHLVGPLQLLLTAAILGRTGAQIEPEVNHSTRVCTIKSILDSAVSSEARMGLSLRCDAMMLVSSLLILLDIVQNCGFVPSRKDTHVANPWASNDCEILQCPEASSADQHSIIFVVESVEGSDGGEGPSLQQECRSSSEMSTFKFQTTVSAIAFHVGGLSTSTKVLLGFILVSNLVGYVCCMAAVLLIQRKPGVAEIFGWIGSGAVALGFLLLILMLILDSLA
nr:hypothetical protein CFP56_75167 [Quercus suber]